MRDGRRDTGEKRPETGDARQEMGDEIRDTRDERQEMGVGRRETEVGTRVPGDRGWGVVVFGVSGAMGDPPPIKCRKFPTCIIVASPETESFF